MSCLLCSLQVLIETIRSMLLPADVAFIAASGDAASSNSDNNVQVSLFVSQPFYWLSRFRSHVSSSLYVDGSYIVFFTECE